MKIAIIRQKYAPYGGAEKFSAQYIDRLAQLGYEVHIFAREWKTSGYPNVHLHQISVKSKSSTLRLLEFNQEIERELSKYSFDLIQSHERTTTQDIYRAGDGCHKEWLAQRKKYYPIKGWLSFLNPFHWAVLKIEREIFTPENYKRIVAISQMVKKDIQYHYKLPDKDISVIHNGVSLKRFHPSNRSEYYRYIRQKLDIPPNAISILTVGSGFERKGLKFLIKSLKYLEAKDWRLIVIGKGNWKKYRRYASWKNRSKLIHIAPPVEEIEQYYAAADIFALPSLYEPFGNANLEALASGLPVVTSKNSGAAELITHKLNGMVVQNPGDRREIAAHLNYLNDKSIRDSMGRQARRLAEEYSHEKNIEKMVRLYKNLALTPSN
jgi:UDP-glucose:(heptosyl)LPS alpha-1,3-glucosyltransferase